jgi:hypothetical protein
LKRFRWWQLPFRAVTDLVALEAGVDLAAQHVDH